MVAHAPLSFSQESLWLTEEIVPGLSQYQMIVVVQLDGELDRAALERSVREIVSRHELLRSKVSRVDGFPCLMTCEEEHDPLGFVDISSVPAGTADAVLETLVSRWYTRSFDLGSPPLLRGELVRLRQRLHILVLATHHFVGDELSMGIVQRELFACYEAFATGGEPDLPELPIQYADYTAWQREEVEPSLEDGLDYWASRLSELPTVSLPVRSPRPAVRSFTAAWADVAVAPPTMAALSALARARDTTVFSVLLAAFYLLLSRWTGAPEVVVGTPVSGRPEPEMENLIGFFVNSVVLRARCEPDEPFTALLDRVSGDLPGDLAADYVPFHRVVERVNPPRQRSRHPLFQTAFQCLEEMQDAEHATMGGLTVTDRSAEFLRGSPVTTEYDLVAEVVISATAPRASFRYGTELFDADAMAELAQQFGRLLDSIAADPGVPPRLPPFSQRAGVPVTPPLAAGQPVPAARSAGAADVTPAQVLLIMGEELRADGLRLEDDFFEVGGSSLIGARVVQRLRDELGLVVTLIDLFDAPTIGDLLAVTGVRAEGDRRQRQPADSPGPVPHAHRMLWQLNKAAGDQAGVYNVPIALRLAGALDVTALQAALQDVAGRHEPLRTILPELDGAVRRVVLEAAAAQPPLEVAAVTPADLEPAVTSAAAMPFDLTSELPWRARLYDVGVGGERGECGEWMLLIVLHCVAADAWSTRPLLQDVTTAYRSRAGGKAPSWDPLPARYRDFAAQGTGPQAQQVEHWKGKLAGLADTISIVADRPRPAGPAMRTASVIFDFAPDAHHRLSALAAEHRCNLFMVLQAGVAALLARHGAGHDIPIGCTVAGRDSRQWDDLVGSFANTLVLRISTDGDPSFVELLRRARRTCLEAFANSDVPFARIVEELGLSADSPWHPLFQVSMTLCTAPVTPDDLDLPALRAELAAASTGLTRYDLAFEFTELRADEEAQLWGAVTYATDLFDHSTVEQLVDAMLALFAAGADDPGAPISQALRGSRARTAGARLALPL